MMKTFSKKLTVFISLSIVSLFLISALEAETRYRVRSSDNLNSIVEQFYENSEWSKGQLLVGVLAKNPSAFKGGNINFLLRGKYLTLPDEHDLDRISPENAREILSEHARFFRIGITGDLPSPISSDLINKRVDLVKAKTVAKVILAKQKKQNKKIDQLQQESNELKKQLALLVDEKYSRDKRLIELEESLKQTLAIEKTESPDIDSVQTQTLNVIKSELADNARSNTTLEIKAENVGEVWNKEPGKKRIIEPSASILSGLIWLVPLALLASFLFYLFSKKKKLAAQSDDHIEVSESGYIETYVERAIELEPQEEDQPLETSVKLDVARAYIEAEDTQSALDILSEIMEEGTDEQRKVAHELLEEILPS